MKTNSPAYISRLKALKIKSKFEAIQSMRTYFAAALLTMASAVSLDPYGREHIPEVRDYLYEYEGVRGHLNQDYYEGRRKTKHAGKDKGEVFDYYPVPRGIDYDDFYPGFSLIPPQDDHHYKDYSDSDGNSFDSYSSVDFSDEDTDTSGTYESSFHDSHSGDAGYLHSHHLSHDSSLNVCGSGRCDSDTYHSESHLDSILDSEYPAYLAYGYAPSSLASSDRADSDLTDSQSDDSYYPSSLGSSGVFNYNPFSVTYDNSDLDSDGYLTTHSSDYSNSSHGFSYGKQSRASSHSDDPERSDFDKFEHDGFGGYGYGHDPYYDYYGRDIHYFEPQRFDYPSNYSPNYGGYGIYQATAFRPSTGS